jgi:multicomponent Na+:H+ antiporter subunit G
MPDFVLIILLLLAALFVLAGTVLSVIGMVGLKRLPDMYTRLHATGKVGLFGVVLLLLGVFFFGIYQADWTIILRAALLFLFLLIVGPTAAHAISSAAYRFGQEPYLGPDGKGGRDDLARDVRQKAEEMLAEHRRKKKNEK